MSEKKHLDYVSLINKLGVLELEIATLRLEIKHLRREKSAAFEEASELVMDHGLIRNGDELVEVCEQIKRLARRNPEWDLQ